MGLELKTENHLIASLLLMISLHRFNYIQNQIEINYILGICFGVGLDFDHVIWALLYDRSTMSKLLSTFSIKSIWIYLNSKSLYNKMGDTAGKRKFVYYMLHIFTASIILYISHTSFQQFYVVIKYSIILHLLMDFTLYLDRYV
jgi:hypothetical protein